VNENGQAQDRLFPGYLTADLPGVGGKLRVELEDFEVEEIPLYGPTGEGPHTLFQIEKRGLSTMRAIQRLARALNMPPRLFGCAGLKDARAVTRQTLSVEGVSPEALLAVEIPDVRVLWAERHRNRLKIGHLRGNRFAIRVREVGSEALDTARRILAELERRGVPNGFGHQRFGSRQNTHLLGRCLVRRDAAGFWRALLGSPRPADPKTFRQARALFDAGDWTGALQAWPERGSDEYRALAALAAQRDETKALRHIPIALTRLYVAAYQSYLFNLLLAERLQQIDQLQPGDLAVKHVNGAYFAVEDAAAEQPRAERLEISPSAPLYGFKVRLAEGQPGERERRLLAEEGIALEDWRGVGGGDLHGERRPLRAPLSEVEAAYDQGLLLRFTLPSGAYATNVLAEVTKQLPAPDSSAEEED